MPSHAIRDPQRAEQRLSRVRLPPGHALPLGADAALSCAAIRLERGETAGAEDLLTPVVAACCCRPGAEATTAR